MGDDLKITKDKRHRSSSNLAGTGLAGTRSERKLDIRALIPEVDDHFTLAEMRCDDLQEKIESVKELKRKIKRSTTQLSEQPIVSENLPFITVRTQPKKKVSQQAARLRRLEVPQNPTRGYLDPATVEQHRMLGQVWGYEQNYKRNQNNDYHHEQKPKTRVRRNRADGDGMGGHHMNNYVKSNVVPAEVACGQDDNFGAYSDTDLFEQVSKEDVAASGKASQMDNRAKRSTTKRRSNYSRNINLKEVPKWIDSSIENTGVPHVKASSQAYRRRQQQYQQNFAQRQHKVEERSVVELFNKKRNKNQSPTRQELQTRPPPKKDDKKIKKFREMKKGSDQGTGQSNEVLPAESKKENYHHQPRRVKYRTRGYELPTMASQLKQADIRYHTTMANRTNIPFIVSKSTAPSHNIGVNIQQVLNGFKIQQPLSGIPLTIAHHMGLGHVPSHENNKAALKQPSLKSREINSVMLGRRLLMLPSYKFNMSYNRLLTLYREGDGMVPRFLRSISRPNYFYTSLYNLTTNREDQDGATSKGRGGSLETKQHLKEYASLYKEYEQVDRKVKELGHIPELERRREELLVELAAREDHIRKLLQESSGTAQDDFNPGLHASASTAEDGYRHSKFNVGDQV